MDNHGYPLVSIGMPIYNEARFIEASLNSILAQDYPNIQIIISDNASTDASLDICQRMVDNRSNVIIHQFANNHGPAANFQYVLSLAKGKYFMWASGHDRWASNIIRQCVDLLESTPTAVIAFGSSLWIDENGEQLPRASGYIDTRGMPPLARFFTIFFGNMHPILGIIRKSALNNAQPVSSVVGSDLILLSELVLQGDFVHAEDTYWQRRDYRHEANYAEKLKRYRTSEYGLTRSLFDAYFPLFRLPIRLARIIIKSQRLTTLDKIASVLALMALLPVRYLIGKQQQLAHSQTHTKTV